MRSPLVSVIIPTHRRPLLLERALRSIKIQQSSESVEVIVVSDVLDLETDTVCANLLEANDIYLRRSGPPGPSTSRNLALNLASGRHVIFLDDDDAWQPNMLQQLLKIKHLQQGLAIYGNCEVFTERRSASGPQILSRSSLSLNDVLNDFLYVKNQVHMSCYVLPRDIIGVTRFDPYMKAYEDWEFLLHIYKKQAALHVPFSISAVFQVDDSTTDRRGSAVTASGHHAILDYLYVYRRHPAPTEEIRKIRADFLRINGFEIDLYAL